MILGASQNTLDIGDNSNDLASSASHYFPESSLLFLPSNHSATPK